MVDFVKIKIRAGNGGRGAVSFFRTKSNPIGRPDGGDGGKGGDLYVEGTTELTTLLDYNFKKHFEAPDGESGGTNQKTGHTGEDLILKVPVGTIITLVEDLSAKNPPAGGITITPMDKKLADITKEGEKILLAKAGSGGKGNMHLKSFHPGRVKLSTPAGKTSNWDRVHHAEPGHLGEEKEIILELKLLADIGLIGFPNAGKSTLLSHLTKATPKIANYPFTTLEPNLGVMTYRTSSSSAPFGLKNKSMVIADIPGLIEGASEGKGLGIQFLKHAQRSRVLVHLISAETEDLAKAYSEVNKELESYSRSEHEQSEFSTEFKDKPQIVFISKTDLADREELGERVKKLPKGLKVLTGSSFSGEGLEKLQQELIKYF